jgi:putative peptidoglycan lipid II flippase
MATAVTDPPRPAVGSGESMPEPEAEALAGVGHAALVLTAGAAAVQILGVVRQLFLAAQVGASSQFDAVLIAMVLPTTIAGVLTSGTIVALVPAYIEARTSGGRPAAQRLSGSLLFWTGVAGLGVTLALVMFADAAVAITGPGLSAAARESAVGYLRLLAPTAFVGGVFGILYAISQAEERFGAIAAATLAGPAASLVLLLVLWDRLGLGAFALGSLLGPVVSLAVLLGASVRRSAAPRPNLGSRGLGLRAVVRHAAPLTLSAAIGQLNMVTDRAIASLLAVGAVSALRYGEVLVRLPIDTIGAAWGAALYPALVNSTQTSQSGLGTSAERTVRYALAVFVPIAALTIAVAPLATSVAYARGAFKVSDLAVTATLVAAFAPLAVVYMTSPILTAALNARRTGSILLIGGTMNVILNFVLNVVLGLSIGVAGVALSSSLTATIVAIYFARRLSRAEPDFRLRPLARTLVISTVCAAPAAIAIGLLSWSGMYPSGLVPELLTLAAFGAAGVASYAALATLLRLEEPRILLNVAIGRLSRAGSTT